MTVCTEDGCHARCCPPHEKCGRHRPPTDRTKEHEQRRARDPRNDHTAARKKAQRECSSCWVVGGHDPRCKRLAGARRLNLGPSSQGAFP